MPIRWGVLGSSFRDVHLGTTEAASGIYADGSSPISMNVRARSILWYHFLDLTLSAWSYFMKLFYAPGSSSLLPHIVLREAELPFEPIRIDEHTKAISGGGDYRSVHALGYVPALVLDDGTLLTEGAAIVQYVADLVPGKKLAPPNGTIERVKLQAWLNFFASEIHKGGFSPMFYKGVPEAGRDVFRARLRARFTHLDEYLSYEYLMRGGYSVADAHFFVVSNWASWVNFDLSPYSAVLAHRRRRIGSRPAVVATLKTEGLVPWPTTQPR